MPRLDDFFRLSASRAELARLGNFNAIRLSCAERIANGKALRRNVPRSSHAEFRTARGRPDPVSVLETQNATRIKELVPVRMARMSVTMAHLRRRPGVAGSRWPNRLERTGRRFAGARRFRTGDQEHSAFAREDSDQ